MLPGVACCVMKSCGNDGFANAVSHKVQLTDPSPDSLHSGVVTVPFPSTRPRSDPPAMKRKMSALTHPRPVLRSPVNVIPGVVTVVPLLNCATPVTVRVLSSVTAPVTLRVPVILDAPLDHRCTSDVI